ncbi:MAG: hypothetical protein ACM3PB_00475 [Betaproteobacteria bacterium]
MKQAIYIFSLYIGVVTFFTLSYFRQMMEISLSVSLLAILVTGAIIFAANKSAEKRQMIDV